MATVFLDEKAYVDQAEDVLIRLDKKVDKRGRPIPQITTRLRTPEGRQRLDDTVSKYASKIKTNLSEKDLLKSLNKLENAIDEKFTKERNAELKRRADAQKQAEANQKKTGTKKVVNP